MVTLAGTYCALFSGRLKAMKSAQNLVTLEFPPPSIPSLFWCALKNNELKC